MTATLRGMAGILGAGTSFGWRAAAVLMTSALVVLSGCASEPTMPPEPQSPQPSVTATGEAPECAAAAETLVDAVAAMVATFDPGGAGSQGAAGDMVGVEDALADSHQAVREHGCDQQLMQDATELGLDELQPSDPVAVAVLARVTNTLLGRASAEATEVVVEPGEDLHQIVARVAAGSTIILPVGEVTLSEPLVFLEGVTVRGAGMDQTTLVSTAPGAAVIDVSGTRLVLEDLAVEVRAVASGIVTGPRAQLVLSSVRLTGAKLDADRTGGAGLHLVGPAPGSTQEPPPGSAEEGATGAPAGQTSVELTDCVIEDNAWAGIVVSGEHRVSIESTTVQESGEVGILFLDSASGSVADSSVLDSPLGIGVAGQATPVLVDLTISGGTVGVQLEGASAATIERLVVGGTEQAGVIITGEATGSLTDVTCEELDFGIVVADTAAPTVTDLDCTVARGS